MSKRVLVAYATGAGSTAGVAETIGNALRELGFEVEVKPVREAGSPQGYDAVVLGSAVRVARWLPAAVSWLTEQRDILAGKPLALFSVCLSACQGDEEGVKAIRDYVASQLAPGLTLLDHVVLAGALEMRKLNFFLRLMMKALRAQEGDFRDPQAIRAWATEIGQRIAASD